MAKRRPKRKKRGGRAPVDNAETMPEHVHVRLPQELHARLLELQAYAAEWWDEHGFEQRESDASAAWVIRALLHGSDGRRTGEASIRLYGDHVATLRREKPSRRTR